MEKKFVIYKHTSPSGKVYIGQTSLTNVINRWRNGGKGYFRKNPVTGEFQQPAMVNAINKYPWDEWKHEIIDYAGSRDEADLLETKYIQVYKSTNPRYGYNITCGGGGHSGQPMKDSTKEKLSIKIKELWNNPEYRNKVTSSLRGKEMHPNTRAALRKANTGRKLSEETKNKIGRANSLAILQFSLDGILIGEYLRPSELEILLKVGRSAISSCCSGRSRSCKGYILIHKRDFEADNSILSKRIELVKNKSGYKKGVSQFLDEELIETFPSITKASEKTGISSTSISNCLRGRSNTAGGYKWKYNNDN